MEVMVLPASINGQELLVFFSGVSSVLLPTESGVGQLLVPRRGATGGPGRARGFYEARPGPGHSTI